ncbi:MAG TPA: universal stress protein [Candidatus Dormibacteraeota bacterium]|nr:universal stress protein [Candidatus Dormibacteraeota bacterium]
MKTILTLVGGGDHDAVVLQTALAAARPLSAHLDCLHAHVPAVMAAHHARCEFATPAAFGKVLERLETEGNLFSRLATDNVRTFCAGAGIEICDARIGAGCVTASFREEENNELECLALHASQSDLVVMGRGAQKQGLSPYTLESLVRTCGRPILVAASTAPRTLDTIMVCWKDSASTGGVVTAAAPLLAAARRVVFVSVAKHDGGLTDAMSQVARQLAGIDVEVRVVPPVRHHIPEALSATAEECGADLVVIGAYGRSRTREVVFGSRTDMLLERIDKPVLLMH